MFDELNRYKDNDHFFYTPTNNLAEVCNAPINKNGVYIFYALKNGEIELIYVGRSGEVKSDGSVLVRKTGLGGLKDILVNGKQFGEPRKKTLKIQMLKENIEALDIYRYVTCNDQYVDCPRDIENKLLQKHFEIYGRPPRWNNEF